MEMGIASSAVFFERYNSTKSKSAGLEQTLTKYLNISSDFENFNANSSAEDSVLIFDLFN